jgi:type I restriction enzyme S subunit
MFDATPDQWERVSLADVSDISRGTSWRDENETAPETEGALPVLGIKNVQANLELTDVTWLKGLPLSAIKSSTVECGDILMVGSNGNPARIGNAVRVDEPGRFLYASLLFGLRPRERVVDGEFFFHLIRSASVQAAISETVQGTTGLTNLKISVLRDIPIPLPRLEEQRRIAAVLRSVDAAIVATLAVIEQGKQIKLGLFQTLFARGSGHTKFKASSLGEIPETWEELPLLDLVSEPITYGVVQPGSFDPDGVLFVRGGDFPDGKIDVPSLRTISHAVARQYKRTQLKGGEILISLVGYPGACAIVPDELAGANIARQAALIRPNEIVSAQYLFQFIRSPTGQQRLIAQTIGSAQQVINLRDLKDVVVAIPPRDEQERIASVLGSFDEFLEDETSKLDSLKSLKGGLLSDLLTGRVRVSS